MGLFSKKNNSKESEYAVICNRAYALFCSGNSDGALNEYKKVEDVSGRACCAIAFLLLNKLEDAKLCLHYLEKADKLNYKYAQGALAVFYYYQIDNEEKAFAYAKKGNNFDLRALFIYLQIIDDPQQKKTLKVCDEFLTLFRKTVSHFQKDIELKEYCTLLMDDAYSLKYMHCLALLNKMYFYGFQNDRNYTQQFLNCYEAIIGENHWYFNLIAAILYAEVSMRDIMSLENYDVIAKLCDTIKDQYAEIMKREVYESTLAKINEYMDDHNELLEEYLTFIKENRNKTIYLKENNSITKSHELTSLIIDGFNRWCNTATFDSESKVIVFDRNGEEYTVDSWDRLIDKYGAPTGLKMDKWGYLSNEETGERYGSFSSDGTFRKY